MHEYSENNSLTYYYQSNFKENFSTNQSLVQLTDIIKRGKDMEMPIIMILSDLWKNLWKARSYNFFKKKVKQHYFSVISFIRRARNKIEFDK